MLATVFDQRNRLHRLRHHPGEAVGQQPCQAAGHRRERHLGQPFAATDSPAVLAGHLMATPLDLEIDLFSRRLVVVPAHARLLADTLIGHVTEAGDIPAVLENDNASRIIPAIEGLVFPLMNGCSGASEDYGDLVAMLEKHLRTVFVDWEWVRLSVHEHGEVKYGSLLTTGLWTMGSPPPHNLESLDQKVIG